MPSVELAIPYLFYDDDAAGSADPQPIRSSHVYIDVPNDDEGFVHFRTDASGRLCVLKEDKQRGTHVAQVRVRDGEYAIQYDEGLLTDEEAKALAPGRGAVKAKLQQRKVTSKAGNQHPQYFFRLPRRPLRLVVDRLEVHYFDAGEAAPRDAQNDLVRPAAPIEVVQPLLVSDGRPRLAKSVEIEGEPGAVRFEVELELREVALAGFSVDEAFRLDPAALGLAAPAGGGDYVKRLLVAAVAERARQAALSSLDPDTHAYIRRRYAKLQAEVPGWASCKQGFLAEYPAKGPADPARFVRTPPRGSTRWEKELFDRLWLHASQAAATTPGAREVESWFGGGQARKARPVMEVADHNRRVLRVRELIERSTRCSFSILAKNVDAVVLQHLAPLRKEAEVGLRWAWEDHLFLRAFFPGDLPPMGAGDPDKQGLIDLGWYVDEVGKREEAGNGGGWKLDPALLAAELERLQGGLAPEDELWDAARLAFSAAQSAMGEMREALASADAAWRAVEAPADRRVEPRHANALQIAAAALARAQFGVRKAAWWSAARTIRATWAMVTPAPGLDAALASAEAHGRADAKKVLERWARRRGRLAKTLNERAKALHDLWFEARKALPENPDFWVRKASQLARAGTQTSEADWKDFAAALGKARDAVRAMTVAANRAIDREGYGVEPDDEDSKTFANVVYASVTATALHVRELRALAHYE